MPKPEHFKYVGFERCTTCIYHKTSIYIDSCIKHDFDLDIMDAFEYVCDDYKGDDQ